MKEEELDVAGGDEARDVVVEELVNALEVPVRRSARVHVIKGTR